MYIHIYFYSVYVFGICSGQQMVNRIPNCYLLTNKLGLLLSLQRFEHVWTALNLSQVVKLRTADFLPETYRTDVVEERKTFFYTFKSNSHINTVQLEVIKSELNGSTVEKTFL